MKILMLHGINHNMFGKRDPKQYGTITLAEGTNPQWQYLDTPTRMYINRNQTGDLTATVAAAAASGVPGAGFQS